MKKIILITFIFFFIESVTANQKIIKMKCDKWTYDIDYNNKKINGKDINFDHTSTINNIAFKIFNREANQLQFHTISPTKNYYHVEYYKPEAMKDYLNYSFTNKPPKEFYIDYMKIDCIRLE